MKRRIIFLDFDGVLNSLLFCEKLSAETTSSAWQERLAANGGSTATREMIDPVAVERLNRLIAETGAEVVVSSSWRNGHLAAWCRSRRGQPIVCEQLGASWLPFRAIGTFKAGPNSRVSAEAVWP